MAHCPNCKHEMRLTDTICPQCGHDFPMRSSERRSGRKKRANSRGMQLINLIMLALCIGYLVFSEIRSRQREKKWETRHLISHVANALYWHNDRTSQIPPMDNKDIVSLLTTSSGDTGSKARTPEFARDCLESHHSNAMAPTCLWPTLGV